jgi:hypothetical protein
LGPDGAEHTRAARIRSAAWRALRNPVPAIFILAGIFDLLSGDFLVHGVVLFAVAGALLYDARARSVGRVETTGATADVAVRRTWTRPPLTVPLVVAGISFAILVARFARYSWPTSLAVFAVAALAIALAWRKADAREGSTPRISRGGAFAWASVFVALALWELTALLLQPSLTTESYAHPTISVLMDSLLATSLGRTAFLLVWLSVGWILLDR